MIRKECHSQISVTKKLRPHWSKKCKRQESREPWHFRNEKVTAPLKLFAMLSAPCPESGISVTKKLRPHWSMLWNWRERDTPYPISVTKKLRPHWSVLLQYIPESQRAHFRNEKVTAPLKRRPFHVTAADTYWISVTKKLRPHWSPTLPYRHRRRWEISVTKKLRPHWSLLRRRAVSAADRNFRNEKVTAPLKLTIRFPFSWLQSLFP